MTLRHGDHRGISSPFGELCPTTRQVTNVLRTRLPLIILRIATKNNPFDLHALDTPPAFILSQDQTLNKTHRAPGETLGSSNRQLLLCGHSSVVNVPARL